MHSVLIMDIELSVAVPPDTLETHTVHAYRTPVQHLHVASMLSVKIKEVELCVHVLLGTVVTLMSAVCTLRANWFLVVMMLTA